MDTLYVPLLKFENEMTDQKLAVPLLHDLYQRLYSSVPILDCSSRSGLWRHGYRFHRRCHSHVPHERPTASQEDRRQQRHNKTRVSSPTYGLLLPCSPTRRPTVRMDSTAQAPLGFATNRNSSRWIRLDLSSYATTDIFDRCIYLESCFGTGRRYDLEVFGCSFPSARGPTDV